MRGALLLFVFLMSLAVSALAGDNELVQTCSASRKNESYAEFIRTLAFDEAAAFCDGDYQRNPKKDCRAGARYWQAVAAFSNGDFKRAKDLFAEAKAIVGDGKEPKEWDKKPGWGSTNEMIRFLDNRIAVGPVSPEYRQKVLIFANNEVDADNAGKQVRKKLDPCDVRHLYLSLGLLSRYLETFTKGQYALSAEHVIVPATVTELDHGVAVLQSLAPWDEDLATLLAKSVKNNDVIIFLYPKGGGVAKGGGYGISLVPGLLTSPFRGGVRLPTGWASIRNFPQILHEYLHTVEAMTGIKSTTHGAAETARVLSFTGLPKGTGESDWAEWYYGHTLQEKADALKAKKGDSGWRRLFGRSFTNPLRLSEAGVRSLLREKVKVGEEALKERLKQAKEQDGLSYKHFNSGRPKDAALTAVEAVRLYPWQETYLSHAMWFLKKSRLPSDRIASLTKEVEMLTAGLFDSGDTGEEE